MPKIALFTVFVLALATTGALTPVVRRWAHQYRWIDYPDHKRKRHDRPTPTLGGVAIVLGFLVGLSVFAMPGALGLEMPLSSIAPWIGALVMIATGLYDDVYGLGFKKKLALQVAAAYLVLFAGYRFDLTGLPFVEWVNSYQHALFTIPLTLLWIVGVINAVNLIDGLDGLAGGVVAIGFVSLGAVFGMHGDLGALVVALSVAGALIGFLVYNFNPASIFMGVSGSLFLGYVLAVYSLEGLAQIQTDPLLVLLVPVVALALPLTDAGLAILRRLIRGRAICAPDHDHIHHRLIERFSQKQAVFLLYGAALWCGLSALLITLVPAAVGYLIFGITLVAAFSGLRMLGYLRVGAVLRLWRRRWALRQRRGQEAGARSREKLTVEEKKLERARDRAPENDVVVERRSFSAVDR